MKTLLALAGLLLMPTAKATESLDTGRMVAVLRALENGPSDNPWQFREPTWRAYSKVPLHTASILEHRRVAWMFTQTCIRQCLSLDLPITARNVALLFSAGYRNVLESTLTDKQRDYAQRAANLYNDQTFHP